MGMLTIIEGEGAGRMYRLGQRVLTIGRGPANLIQLLDPAVSRRHATVHWDGTGYVISDLKSINGISVNGESVEKARLEYGDVIQVGETLFKLVQDEADIEDSVLMPRMPSQEAVRASTVRLDSDTIQKVTRMAREASGQGASDKADAQVTARMKRHPVNVDEEVEKAEEKIKRDTNRMHDTAREKPDKEETINGTLAYIVQTLDSDRCIAYRIEGKKLKMDGFASIRGLDPSLQAVQPLVPTVKRVVKSGEPTVDNDIKHEAIFSAAAVPVLRGKELLGVVYTDSMRRNPRYFIEQDVRILKMVTNLMGMVW